MNKTPDKPSFSPEEDLLIREVSEDLRREQLEQLWKRYGNLFIAVSAAIVLLVAGYKGWQYYQARQAEAAGAQLVNAVSLIEDGKTKQAMVELDAIIEKGGGPAAALARLHKAALLSRQGKRKEAIALYEQVAADDAASTPLRDAARIRHAWLIADDADAATLKKLLAGMDVKGHAFAALAHEALALAAIRAGDMKEARRRLQAVLNAADTPPNARERARVLLESLGAGQ